MRLEGEVAVVTGGGSGIGEATALLFAEEGASVVVVDRHEEAARAVADSIRERGGVAVPHRCDVSVEREAVAIARLAVERFGKATILVNNAGVRVYGLVPDATEESWDVILGTNLKGVAYCCKGLIPVMASAGGGSIVNVSSANAIVGRASMPQYDATKAGVLALTRALAVAHGKDGIRVNAVCPGPTITAYHLVRAAAQGVSEEEYRARAASANVGILKRHAEPREIAAAILFLASREASYITGETLMVDGGMSAT
jgi:NAD(P)-dependent dehydrogenase (short-subunit alcohol dehydrogenase family)